MIHGIIHVNKVLSEVALEYSEVLPGFCTIALPIPVVIITVRVAVVLWLTAFLLRPIIETATHLYLVG